MVNTQKNQASTPKSESSTEVFTGLIMYPKLHKTDSYKGSVPRWTLDLLLNVEELKRAKAMNLRVKKIKRDGSAPYADMFEGYDGSFLRLTKNSVTHDGRSMEPPKVLDENRNVVDPTAYAIGNGTLAKVKVYVSRDLSPEDFKEFGGYKSYMNAVRVMKLVPYASAGFSDDPDFVESAPSGAARKATNTQNKSASSDGFDWDTGDSPFDDDSGQTVMAAG